jgi:hypothetical protein
MLTDFAIRRASLLDGDYVMALQRANRESVGGLPRPAIDERLGRGTVVLGILNGDPMGYLMWDYRLGAVRIPQACIQYDARRRKYGEALVAWLVAAHPQANEIRLRCAADLEANVFWRDMGFSCTATTKGGARRGRLINAWLMDLGAALLLPPTIQPSAQLRVDTMYDDTDFMTGTPAGFLPATTLPKLAWANRKKAAS